jgi:hypothetical protein
MIKPSNSPKTALESPRTDTLRIPISEKIINKDAVTPTNAPIKAEPLSSRLK